jgi:hypothetical protein
MDWMLEGGQQPSDLSTELVMVPVIMHKGGIHLGGLKKESFELLEDGKAEEIAVFEEVHAAPATESRPADGEL